MTAKDDCQRFPKENEIMAKAKCAKCGTQTEFPKLPKKFVCPECGVLNTPQPATAGTADQACGCILPTSFEWRLPAGEFETPEGPLFSTADDGTKLTLQEWIETFGSNPRIARAWMKKMGIEGKPGFVNVSTLGKKIK